MDSINTHCYVSFECPGVGRLGGYNVRLGLLLKPPSLLPRQLVSILYVLFSQKRILTKENKAQISAKHT